MAAQISERTTRRAILTAAAGGAAALAINAIVKPSPAAAAVGNMQTETDNATSAPTGVSNSSADSGGLFGHASGSGTGSEGTSVTGIGLKGMSTDASSPSTNANNVGVYGIAGDGSDILPGVIPAGSGVFGHAPASPDAGFGYTGVYGDSDDYGLYGNGGIAGVFGAGGSYGVIGAVYESGTVGVLAYSEVIGGRALRVEGRAEFTRSGRAKIPSGASTRRIYLTGCSSSTLVFAVLGSNRSGRFVRAVVPTTGYFTVYLNTTVASATFVNWIAFTNPANHGG